MRGQGDLIGALIAFIIGLSFFLLTETPFVSRATLTIFCFFGSLQFCKKDTMHVGQGQFKS